MRKVIDEKKYVVESYDYIEQKLIEIDNLIKGKSSPVIIKTKYKELKDWARTEYNKTHKAISMGEYIYQWYEGLITDIYIKSFRKANANGPMPKIEDAIINAIDYLNYHKERYKKYANKCSKQ